MIREGEKVHVVSRRLFVLPDAVDLERLEYRTSDQRMAITDGSDWELAVHEFSASR